MGLPSTFATNNALNTARPKSPPCLGPPVLWLETGEGSRLETIASSNHLHGLTEVIDAGKEQVGSGKR